MDDPQQEKKKSRFSLGLGLFRRDKNRNSKPKAEVTSATRDQRAFSISLGTALLFLVCAIVFGYTERNQELLITNTRVLSTFMTVMCFISTVLARRGSSALGITILLTSFYVVALLGSLATANVGLAIAVFVMLITLGITSSTMPPSLAARINVVALIVAAFPVLLDLFEPFARKQGSSATATLVMVITAVAVFSTVVVRRFNSYNLRTKLIIAFAVVTILPLLTLAFYANTRLSDSLYQSAQETLGELANHTASRVDTFIETELGFVQTQSQNPSLIHFLALNPTQRKGTKEESDAQALLDVLASQDMKFIKTYALLDNTGSVILTTVNKNTLDQSQIQFLKDAGIQNKVALVGPFIDQNNGKGNLYFSSPIKNELGTTVGVLVAQYDAAVIEALVENIIPVGNPKKISFVVVLKDTFTRIVNTNDSDLLYKSYKDFSPEEVAALQKQGLLLPGAPEDVLAVEKETVAGLEKLAQSPFFTIISDRTLQTKDLNSGSSLKNVPWIALIRQSETEILTPVVSQRRTTVILFLVILGLVTLVAFGLSQLLASPILKLASTAQKIAAGDLSLQSDIESNDEIGRLAGAFNEMTRQTRALIDSLEQRSKALATSSEVSRRISTILDQQQLVTEVVKQVQGAFNYYHAHIYLMDEKTQELIMAGGTGEAGKAMLARGHKIPIGKGLVGRAAQNNVTVLVTDVSEDPQWLPNPLLPETKSEVAVPISIAEKVLGVLDVQHNVAGVLKQEDVDVLQSIANQVAFAVRNARSYAEVEAKADRESLITSIGQKIQGTITVEGALQVAIREIGRALNGAKTQVMLNENSSNEHVKENENTVAEPEN